MKNIIFFGIIIFVIFSSCMTKNKEPILQNNGVEELIDENKYIWSDYNFRNGDNGLLLNEIKESELNGDESIVEKIFINNISKNEIYYIGAEYRGEGVFWVYNNGKKVIILETHIRYGPKIYWHGENIAEIIIPTGSPFSHSYFYDFDDKQISSSYDFPIYYDVEDKVVLVWGNIDFELYDTKTNNILKVYNSRRMYGMTPAWPYIKYYIEKEKDKIIIYYNDTYSNIKDKIILDNIKKINGT